MTTTHHATKTAWNVVHFDTGTVFGTHRLKRLAVDHAVDYHNLADSFFGKYGIKGHCGIGIEKVEVAR